LSSSGSGEVAPQILAFFNEMRDKKSRMSWKRTKDESKLTEDEGVKPEVQVSSFSILSAGCTGGTPSERSEK